MKVRPRDLINSEFSEASWEEMLSKRCPIS